MKSAIEEKRLSQKRFKKIQNQKEMIKILQTKLSELDEENSELVEKSEALSKEVEEYIKVVNDHLSDTVARGDTKNKPSKIDWPFVFCSVGLTLTLGFIWLF